MKQSDNETMCHIEPGSQLHPVLASYWMPAALATSVEAGGAPKAIKLLGRSLVLFRSPNGALGLLDERCPHRGVTLTLARNEECGLRCIYHGWQMSPDGVVVDVPSEPGERAGFGGKVPVAAHAVREAGGIIWAALDTGTELPEFPAFDFTELPDDHRLVMKAPVACNWVQILEGNLDSAHVSMLHSTENQRYVADLADRGALDTDGRDRGSEARHIAADSSPDYAVEPAPYGFSAIATRKLADGRDYVRTSEYIFPWYVLVASSDLIDRIAVMVVPVDDVTSECWFVFFNGTHPLEPEGIAQFFRSRVDDDPENFRKSITPENQWGQDRAAMAGGDWSGIGSLYFEDIAVQEGAGAIVAREHEHLGSSDKAIILLRRMILGSIQTLAGGGTLPALGRDFAYGQVRAGEVVQGTAR